MIGAGLLIHSVARIAKVEPGIAAHNVLTMGLSLPDSRYARGPQVADGFERVLSAVRRVPGVIAASATSALPLGGGGFYLGRVFLRDGQPDLRRKVEPEQVVVIAPDDDQIRTAVHGR